MVSTSAYVGGSGEGLPGFRQSFQRFFTGDNRIDALRKPNFAKNGGGSFGFCGYGQIEEYFEWFISSPFDAIP